MVFEIRLHPKSARFLSELITSGLDHIHEKIINGLEQLSGDPLHSRPGVDVIQLKSVHPKMYRFRVGQYRVIYEIDRKSSIVYVTMILHRKQAYK